MKRKYLRKKDLKLYKSNKENLFKNENIKINDIVIWTMDYKLKNVINTKIKDLKEKELEEWKEDKEYYKLQKENCFNNLRNCDLIYYDWWRIGNIKKDFMKYVSISTPYIVNTNSKKIFDFEIKRIISDHLFKIYGYKVDIPLHFFKTKNKEYYEMLPPVKLRKIKNVRTLIDEWFKNIKEDNEYYIFYKNLILNNNNKNLNLKKPIYNIEKKDNTSYIVFIPFNYDKKYTELFVELLSGKIKKDDIFQYTEDYIISLLPVTQKYKDFLKQFIPYIPKLKNRKKRFLKNNKNKTYKIKNRKKKCQK